jgi:hypothetical protein
MSNTLLAALEISFAVGLAGFWSYFFLFENKSPARSAIYLGFERSFPVADLGWVAPCLAAAAAGVLREQKFGYILTIAGGGALIFLGLVDISFNIMNKQYTSNLADGIMNAFINASCMVFGPLFIVVASRHLA